jgi:hypothetical protein
MDFLFELSFVLCSMIFPHHRVDQMHYKINIIQVTDDCNPIFFSGFLCTMDIRLTDVRWSNNIHLTNAQKFFVITSIQVTDVFSPIMLNF